MHFHISGVLDFKQVRNSAIQIIIVLLIAFAVDKFIGLPESIRLFVYLAPFVLHLLLSFFMKKKESWLLGGILGTLVSMAVIVVVLLAS
ncbi:hypothetical protein EXW96_18575 [Paenibacillus sp. JMULE4]|uniref:AI-2E family transporter n=1 Tax=Paenibacillus validus TaxID=44253 RepID=A0A7X2ZF74_9BACL|nr:MULTISPECIES: hypothetical protein [Paenibacillus]MUG73036.1 hypothetical protein [Paenibacillus validus]NTZ19495.1 hypothetical protein [Paenibacillus sp. JMULE4]